MIIRGRSESSHPGHATDISNVNKLLATSQSKNVATRALYDIAGLLYLAIASNEPTGDIIC